MEKSKLRNRLKKSSVKDEGWITKARKRKENRSWMDFSFHIAVRIASVLEQNKESGKHPSNQKELATLMECSAQYVNKILRGKENLTLETIVKIADALGGASLIETSVSIDTANMFTEITEIAIPRTNRLLANYFDIDWIENSFSGAKVYKHSGSYADVESSTVDYDNFLPCAA